MGMNEDQFEDALGALRERFAGYKLQMGVCIGKLIIERGLNTLVLEQETWSIDHLCNLERFSMLPQVSGNNDELRFLGVHIQDYMQHHYVIRGMAADVRDGKVVNRKIVTKVIPVLYGFQKGLEDALRMAFSQDYYKMLGESCSSKAN